MSDLPGTTTDPVRKTMELKGVGPVVWVDTAGIDDIGHLGSQRAERSRQTLLQMDLVLLLFSENTFGEDEEQLIQLCQKHQIPFILVYSLSDKYTPDFHFVETIERRCSQSVFLFSFADDSLRNDLLDAVGNTLSETAYAQPSLLGNRIGCGDVVLLVVPIDSAAPTGRLILPQVQVLRDILDHHAQAIVCRETELNQTLRDLSHPPSLVITDSQVFHQVSDAVPEAIPLTSFSIILAHSKGPFELYLQGATAVDGLQDGDRVLMLESCTHNATCEDIGRVKLPRMLNAYTGRQIVCEAVAGLSAITRSVREYSLVIQCGGCVFTPRQLRSRLAPVIETGIPVTNYGIALAHLNGILPRAVRFFKIRNNMNG